MVGLENILYDQSLAHIAKTYIIDGVCVKSRETSLNLSIREIYNRVINYDNVVIQYGENIDVYCDSNLLEHLKVKLSNKDSYLYKAYINGKFSVYTKKYKDGYEMYLYIKPSLI